ncbi:ABC transporter permease [Candidatus Dependentiae bacterium]|nr:ABC transporter permease [Candidatus Dependentiae bacterium]
MLFSKNIFYFAQCFITSKHQNPAIKVMIKTCQIAIMIATFALALIFSIMTGFEEATYQKMQSIYPDIIIDSDDQNINLESWNLITQENKNLIQSYAEQRINQALFSTSIKQNPTMIIIHGINAKKESLVSNIESKIISQEKKLEKIISKNKIIIGSKLAENLNLTIDDTALLLCPENSSNFLNIEFKSHIVIINGIFQTGIEDFDANLIYCDQDFYTKIFPESNISHIHIKLTNVKFEEDLKKILNEQLHANIYSWKDLYPSLLSALKLEKWAMFFILILIICVASMNIISVIFMYIAKKQRDIVILLCMGMTRKKIQAIFICLSIFIALPAATLGLMLAAIIGIILKKYLCLKLPDSIYDAQFLPIKLELHIFCVILILTILISLLASLYATKNIRKINIIELLKTI